MIKTSHFKKNQKFYHMVIHHETNSFLIGLNWTQMCFAIEQSSLKYQVENHALVMLTTHSHLLFSIRNDSENYFAESVQNKISNSNLEEPVFIERITNLTQFLTTYKYIYRNPVEAGLAARCEDYLFSTLGMLLDQIPRRLNIWDPLNTITNPNRVLEWLNSKDQRLIIKAYGRQDISASI